ncbi:MAG TPA: alpha/beta hydrolase [Ruminococcaceae bacterium]|nr:alpha/beta hydrolase [Oscillospiraceae bacterium]
MKKMYWAIGIVVFLIILFFLGAYFLAAYIMTGKRQTYSEARKWQSERYDTSFYDKTDKKAYTIKSYDGYVLHAELLKCEKSSGKYIIISHGYTDNKFGALKYARMYLEKGFNCITYDLRGHGKNEKTFTTYGIREGKDLAELIKDTRKRYDDISVLGLHGESLGAATTVTSLKYKPDVDFAVSDCAFADICNVLRQGYKNAHVPVFLVDVGNIGANLFYRYSLKDMRPIDSLEGNSVPILFVHGEKDDFISPYNTKRMYKTADCVKMLYISKNAGHAESVLKNYDEYSKKVDEFFEKAGIE